MVSSAAFWLSVSASRASSSSARRACAAPSSPRSATSASRPSSTARRAASASATAAARPGLGGAHRVGLLAGRRALALELGGERAARALLRLRLVRRAHPASRSAATASSFVELLAQRADDLLEVELGVDGLLELRLHQPLR